MRTSSTKSGYTLLFAVLIATLVLGVAAFILGVARKQYILSSTAKDSMYSFYAADSGMECIAKDARGNGLFLGTSTLSVSCGGQTRTIEYPANFTPDGTYKVWSASTTFGFASEDASGNIDPTVPDNRWGCAVVTIDQKYNSSLTTLITVIKSRGYNICDYDSGKASYSPAPSSRTAERALQWVVQ